MRAACATKVAYDNRKQKIVPSKSALTDREQRVKLCQYFYSEWRSVPASVLQGAKFGPWLFVVTVNDPQVLIFGNTLMTLQLLRQSAYCYR